MTLLADGIKEIVKGLDVVGGATWAGERLIGRVRFLAERYNFGISISDNLDKVERVLQPHDGEWVTEGPFLSDLHFSIRSMLDDIATLRSSGVTELDPWWFRLGWRGCLSSACLSDAGLASLLDEEYRRAQLLYKEMIEASFPRFAGNMILYPILPLRWNLRVVRGGPLEGSFTVYPRWTPVRSWKEAGADVSFEGPLPDPMPPWDEIGQSLIALGRPPNIAHYGGFSTHLGYDGRTLMDHHGDATRAASKAISWLKEEVKRIFKNLPASDGSFSV